MRGKQHSIQRKPVCVIQKSMSVYRLCTLRCEQFGAAGEAREHTTREADAGHQESTRVQFSQQLFAWSDAERKLSQNSSSKALTVQELCCTVSAQTFSRIQICGLLMCAKVFIYGTWFNKSCAQFGSTAVGGRIGMLSSSSSP